MPGAFREPFVSSLDAATQTNAQDDPNYYVQDPRSLITTSNVHTYMNGTGSNLYRSLAPLLQSANQELILVTCFWARSSSLDILSDVLRKLSDKATRRGTEKIKVRLCFSSLSVFQKLFHTQSVRGQTYPSHVWMKKLGLPDPSKLGGLDLQIKSVFILPFSVMHPKFMIIDRSTVILPSCNISWEEWFEGAVTLSGPVVGHFLQFYNSFWNRRADVPPVQEVVRDQEKFWNTQTGPFLDLGNGHVIVNFSKKGDQSSISDIPTVFLPSPHHRHPRFQPFTSSERIIAPPTPLNAFFLTVIAKAENSIRIQTPNITSPPVLCSLLKALERGIDVQILTSERLMILEQLVTAGTTTSRCIKTLIKRYRKLLSPKNKRPATDEEAAISAPPSPGRLHVSYFEPLNGPKSKGKEDGEPQQSHLKMTIVDDEVLVLGSGNLDRASWFTSQELGIAFFDQGLVGRVKVALDEAMRGRSRVVFEGGP